MRWLLIAPVLLGCGRTGFDHPNLDSEVGFDAAGDAPEAASFDPDLVVWLPFDDDPAAGVIDRAGTLAPGRCDGGPCPVLSPGRIGGGYDFRGATGGGAIRFESSPALDFGSRGEPMSIALWYRTRTLGAAQQVALAKPIAGGQVSYQLALEDVDLDGVLDLIFKVCELTCNGESFATAAKGAEQDAWRLIVGVWDGTESRLYIDGVLRGTQQKQTITFDDSPLFIGADLEQSGVADVFEGSLDDIRIYKRTLSKPEQQALLVQ